MLDIRVSDTFRDLFVETFQQFAVSLAHLERHYLLAAFSCFRIFMLHYVIGIFEKARCYHQCKSFTLLKCSPYCVIEIFPRNKVFIIPDRYIPVLRLPVDHAHQLLRISAVLFPVAEKDIGIKSGPDSFREFISHKHL